MTRASFPFLLIFTSFVFLFASCSQEDQPSSPTTTSGESILAKPGGGNPTYTATHSSYNSATSYVSGTISGMTHSNGGISKDKVSVTFHGFIAAKIRAVTPIGGSGSLSLNGLLNINDISAYTQPNSAGWNFSFRWPQTNSGTLYHVYIGGIVSPYHGTISGTFPAPAEIVFDANPFQIQTFSKGNTTVLWGYNSWSSSTESVSVKVNTSSP